MINIDIHYITVLVIWKITKRKTNTVSKMLTEALSSHSLLTFSRTSDELAMVTQQLSSIRQHMPKIFYLKPSYKNQSSPESNLYRIPHDCGCHYSIRNFCLRIHSILWKNSLTWSIGLHKTSCPFLFILNLTVIV
jgi:hypothetical protein